MKSGYLFKGVLLITAGILLLLANLGYLKPYFWWQLIQLWPVLLIAFGLRLIGKESRIINSVVLILVLGTVGYAVWVSQTEAAVGPKDTVRFNQTWSEEISEVDLTVNFGDGVLEMNEGTAELVRADLDYFREEPEWDFTKNGDRSTLVITQEELRSNGIQIPGVRRQDREWKLLLHDSPLWLIKLNSGACKIDADFSRLNVGELEVNTGASDIKIKLSELKQDADVVIKAGASNVQLLFPENAGVRAHISGALSNDNLSESGFTKVDEIYYSPGYDQAEYHYELDISIGVSNVNILFY